MSEGLNLIDYIAAGISRDDEILKAIFSNADGEGAIANELELLVQFIEYYITTDNVINHKGKSLDQIVTLFTKLLRFINEGDSSYLRRMRSLTQRQEDKVWGTAWNIIHVFEAYFPGRRIYLCENTVGNNNNLVSNGDFEEDTGWELDTATMDYTAGFSLKRGLCLENAGSCTQTLENIDAGIYMFHFFLKGKCGVQIINSQGKYYKAEMMEWSGSPFINNLGKDEWDNITFLVTIPQDTDVVIGFTAMPGETGFVDYVRFAEKEKNPSFTVLVYSDSDMITDKTLHLAEGESDPSGDIPDYNNESYFDKSFVSGPGSSYTREIYREILDTVRPVGIKAYIDFISRE
jgi:hypothetical protein